MGRALSDTLRVKTASPDETRRFGGALGRSLAAGAFVGLEGPLGSGKTVIVQGAARALGYDGYVTSPSFVIVNEYDGRVPVFHVDLYRIADARELEDIGYREIFFCDGVAMVEWADRVPELLPPDRLRVVIEMDRGDVRNMTVSGIGPGGARLLGRLRDAWQGE
ncbi:MAG: tRNA (adenosine(37)-N6)-threonylcarbamoyltransferase complex ATPase subunit type 1 TsaE [Candidatus Eisenbacteria bacterium]|nr:tRNA (adenosine(37)-N6)-threonylcarbamoyltransferase complex ATPase subunit type 1 TsaE [Candidatus Eisenbacteria bacterium]